jgi:hypothetical protein
MGAQPLGKNVPLLSSAFDANNSNSVEPSAGQRAAGFIPNVDNVDAESQNFMHGASTAFLFLAQQLGIFLPFNPDSGGGSILPCPSGGIVSLQQSGGATEFYVCQNPAGMAAGFTDPSADPTNWALINFRAIATYTMPYADATGTSDAITVSYPSMIYPVLSDGFAIRVGISTPNLTTTPTISASFNGQTPTAYTIKKQSPAGLIPLAAGDLFGSCQFEFDQPNLCWVLTNPPGHEVKPGSLVLYCGSTLPPGVLQIPSAVTNISRAAYPALTAVIVAAGSPWGNGDGSTTIGMPYIPPGYAILNYVGLGSLGAITNGVVIDHVHKQAASTRLNVFTGSAGYGSTGNTMSLGGATQTPSSPQGGPNNLAAGMLFNVGVKY